MPGFLDRIHAKLELFRLEQRYTRRRHRRSTFVSTAVYVDGEYVYQTPTSTGSSNTSNTSGASTNASSLAPAATAAAASPQQKLRNRLSMPSFGSLSKGSSRTQDWRTANSTIYEGR